LGAIYSQMRIPPFSTMDVVIQEIEGIEFDKIFDPETNSALLRARRIE